MLWEGFVSFIGGVALSKSAQYFPCLTAFLGLALFTVLLLKKRPILIPVLIAGALFAFVQSDAPPLSGNGEKFPASVLGYASPAVAVQYGFSQIFHITGFTGAETQKVFPYDEIRLYTREPLAEGKQYLIQAKIGLPVPRLDPGFTNSSLKPAGDLMYASCTGSAPLVQRMRSRLNNYYMRNFPPGAAGFLMSITTGERAMLTDRIRQDFSNCGLAHLISIAGLHFGMFSLSIFLLISITLRFFIPLRILER